MRVSTSDDRQSVDRQRDALAVAGADECFDHGRATGSRYDQLSLYERPADLRSGDALVVMRSTFDVTLKRLSSQDVDTGHDALGPSPD